MKSTYSTRNVERMQLDFKDKKTEGDWHETFKRFWLAVTPKWFEWLGWVLILGVIKYATEKYNSLPLNIINSLSFSFFFMYFLYFIDIEFDGLPFIKSRKLRIMISSLLSGVISFGVWLLLYTVIKEIAGKV